MAATVPGAQPAGGEDRLPSEIGPYRILERIGEGGMGVVYLAEQRTPVARRVALKAIKLGMDTKAVLARFQAEQRALAAMEHSCIARMLDAGISADGRPYFVMEYIAGIPITDYCDRNRLDTKARIHLFQRVCSAVQHAHERGIVHRDLKPSNILVTVRDGQPEPRIIDFGLAKALNHRLVEATVFTEQGQIIGTPEYMSPEQAGTDPLGVDARTDIYSLGVLLQELLIGTRPFSRRELRHGALDELQRVIREQRPERASSKLSRLGPAGAEVAAARHTDTRSLQTELRRALDAVILKAIEKDRLRRYQTASEFAADLARYLGGQAPAAVAAAWHGPAGGVRKAIVAAIAVAAFGAGYLVRGIPLPRLSSVITLPLSVNPPDATVYLNGERIGPGNARPVRFDFSEHARVYVQCLHPDYLPTIEWFTPERADQMRAMALPVQFTLRPR
ncbi:MAG: serine/threonine-protein kinase [Planctomycetota bacterium]